MDSFLTELGLHYQPNISSAITAATFIVQVFGPMGVKLAIQRAGEIGAARVPAKGWASEGQPDQAA